MDKFPEAFRRFENVVDVESLKSLRELEMAFSSWAGHKWRPTRRQFTALSQEARRLGIPIRPEKPIVFTETREAPRYRVEYLNVKGRTRRVFRNVKTGQFMKNPKR